ncbi:helix-turn-helix protein [Krasilnikovia cinnamomea]|uniref:Helix-turn-helix protein n=1 Tax=Krasilnikovia cinnamomea TaxID=349313 RepID=A0A4Q7ZEE6_9ACTN|nr:helix-turn-helix transcriptional regulator [Krasilnikovia cinnamomea]RZU48621.1 helix-turn-helix protein [Krasilnikovia cinnamomea]
MPLTDDSQAQDRHRIEFATTDPERAMAYLNAAFGSATTIHSHPDTYRFKHRRLSVGPFCLDSLEHHALIEYRCDTETPIMVTRVHRGCRTDLDRGIRYGIGDLGLHVNTGRLHRVRQEALEGSLVGIAAQVVVEVARNDPECPGPPLRFTAVSPDRPADVRRWLHVVDYVTDSVQNAPDFIAHPLLVGPFARLLAATLLTTFPNTCATEPHHYDRTDATVAALSRAVGFLEANADLDISVVDVARAARVTVRAVQRAFRRHLGTTPMAYLRRVRLARAHDQLRAAEPGDGTTVADVAFRWGFGHVGRFTGAYRQIYGEQPGQTLRR